MNGSERHARLSDARLYLCTPLRPDLPAFVDQVLGGGVDIVQLRDKSAKGDVLTRAALDIRAACERHGALFIVNDDPRLAVSVGADGVHVGQDDPDPETARTVVGEAMLIGRSTHSVDQIDLAVTEPCDYFAVGPVNATPTKQGRAPIGLDPVRHARDAVKPWFVTGGMAVDTAGEVLDAGATRLVVVRALTEAIDPAAVARELSSMLRN